ncbi:MAG: VanZ family protein [Nanoarchaeota archaeon]
MIKFFEENYKLSWFITLVGAVLIFWISSLNFGGSVVGDKGWISIVYHFSSFFCFSFFLFISLTHGRKNYLLFFAGFLISVAYAISDEIHQYFVPWRFCDIFDVFVDIAGIIFAMMIYLVIVLWRGRVN